MFFTSYASLSPQENLAWDEAIVELADQLQEPGENAHPQGPIEVLRVWEFAAPTVVLGRSSRISQEVHLANCEADQVPVLRRASGGATIVAGPGCLMYSVLLDYRSRPECRSIDVAHRVVMGILKQAVMESLKSWDIPRNVEWLGTCDLAISQRKFSGNALRCKRNVMLYHGTFLINMPLQWISTYLLQPPRQPTYRRERAHTEFVQNVLPDGFDDSQSYRLSLIERLQTAWHATENWDQFPWKESLHQKCQELLQDRYMDPNWHRERL